MAKFWNRLSHECDLWRSGFSLVAGVDEAGCGPLAGPVVSAAVVFPCAWLESGQWDVEIAGKRYPATVSLRPMYDPDMKRIKS